MSCGCWLLLASRDVGDAELRKELSSAVYQELLHAKHAEERGMFYACASVVPRSSAFTQQVVQQ